MSQTEQARWIEGLITDFIDHSPENTLQNAADEKAFASPLIGFARGDDPLFEAFKEHVGPFHLTPWEILALTFDDPAVRPAEIGVISWILPQNALTKAENSQEKTYPSERWARGRVFGEIVNEKLRRHVVASLASKGIQAVAPVLSPQFSWRISPRHDFASTWSERHAAFAAGLGTFGLCDGLITPAGKAMRTGSVVARIPVSATQRPYTDHRAYCLFFSRGTCGKCIPRCPVGAITARGKDKRKCAAHVGGAAREYVKSRYGLEGYACGLCQTGVPCESGIPAGD